MLVVSCVLLVTPLAYGTPPDPGWIGGIWDDGDADTVVAFVLATVGTATARSEAACSLFRGERLSARRATIVRAAPPSDSPTRAPPVA
jgi:hypothetical protein